MWYRVIGEYGPCAYDFYERYIFTNRGDCAAHKLFKHWLCRRFGDYILDRMVIYVSEVNGTREMWDE